MPALIAILAILLLFIAPDISQSLMHRQSPDGMTEAMHDMSAMHDDMNMQSMTTDDISSNHSSVNDLNNATQHAMNPLQSHAMSMNMGMGMGMGMGMMDEFACGYCQLLVHVPMLMWLFVPVLLLMLLVSQSPPIRPLPTYHLTVYPGPCQPRAPPVFNS